MTDAKVRARIAARRWAEESHAAADDKPAFVQRVMELGGTAPKPDKPIVPMTDEEAVAFEAETVFFGSHPGWTVNDTPLSYLANLVDPPKGRMAEFLDKVRRYLRNPEVKALLEEDES